MPASSYMSASDMVLLLPLRCPRSVLSFHTEDWGDSFLIVPHLLAQYLIHMLSSLTLLCNVDVEYWPIAG
eukprot:10913592-Karenia_brevis.AAC.1